MEYRPKLRQRRTDGKNFPGEIVNSTLSFEIPDLKCLDISEAVISDDELCDIISKLNISAKKESY